MAFLNKSGLSAALLAGCVMAFSATSAQAECGAIIVTWEEWEPFAYKDKDGKLTGLDIELVTAALNKAGCQVAYQEMPWARTLNGVEAGDVDVAMAASKTPEREAYGQFSEAYRQETPALWVAKGTAGNFPFKTLEDMKGATNFRLNVTRDYAYGPVWDKIKELPEIKALTEESANDEAGVKKLVGGRVQGAFMDLVAGTSLTKTLAVSDKVEVHPMPVYSSDVFVMFSKRRTKPEVVSAFNEGMKAMKADGSFDAIYKKYVQ